MAINKAQGLLQREVAELLNVSRARIAQLVAEGHLRRNAGGKIDHDEVERCKREAPVAWTHPTLRGGRPSKKLLAERRAAAQWQRVAGEMRREGWGDMRNDQWRRLFKDLSGAMRRNRLET
jgi:hypothetical protein